MSESVYLGNPNLKKANVAQEWTKKEIKEYAKCMKDPIYFIQEYVRIIFSVKKNWNSNQNSIFFEITPFFSTKKL